MTIKATLPVHVIEMTEVVGIPAGSLDGTSGGSGSPGSNKKPQIVTGVALASLAHQSSPTPANRHSTSSDSSHSDTHPVRQGPRPAWGEKGSISKSHLDLWDKASWIDETAGGWEASGKMGCVGGAILRLGHGIYDIGLKKPVGVVAAGVVALAAFVTGVVVGIFGSWSKSGRQFAKDCFQISRYNVKQIEYVTGNPFKLTARTGLTVVSIALAVLVFVLGFWSQAGRNGVKTCAKYAAYNLLCATRNVGQISSTVSTGVPRFIMKRTSCGSQCLTAYWRWVSNHMPKPSLPSSYKASCVYRFVRECVGGVDLIRNIADSIR